MNNVRTVSDTKRAFYGQHTRPINAIYRRVVEELMVEMHLLLVNANFNYDSIYALGVVNTFDRFMQGYEPERDRDAIYTAIIESVEADPAQYRRDAEEVLAAAKSVSSLDEFKSLVDSAKSDAGSDALKGNLHKVISNPKFKYSRLFVIGLYNAIEVIDADALQNKEKRESLMDKLAEDFSLSAELLKKDIDLYRGNLTKMAQAQEVMKDMVEAEKKKKAKREEERKEKAAKKAATEAAPNDAAPEVTKPETTEPQSTESQSTEPETAPADADSEAKS